MFAASTSEWHRTCLVLNEVQGGPAGGEPHLAGDEGIDEVDGRLRESQEEVAPSRRLLYPLQEPCYLAVQLHAHKKPRQVSSGYPHACIARAGTCWTDACQVHILQ